MSFKLYIKKLFTALGLVFVMYLFMNIVFQILNVVLRVITESVLLQYSVLFVLSMLFLSLVIYNMRIHREADFKYYSMEIYDGKKFNLKKELRSVLKSDLFIAEAAVCGTLTLFASSFALLMKGGETDPISLPTRLLTSVLVLLVLSCVCFVCDLAVWAFVRLNWHRRSAAIKEKFEERKRRSDDEQRGPRFNL